MDTRTQIKYLRDEIESAAHLEAKLDRYARNEDDPQRQTVVHRDLEKVRRILNSKEALLQELTQEDQ